MRGLLAGLLEIGAQDMTILGNRHVGDRYAGWPVRVEPRYRPGDADATRFLAMHAGRLWPRLKEDADVVHYPVTVPVPRIESGARVVSLLDVQHHELPGMFSAAERRFRGWAYDDAARRADAVITISEHARRGIVDVLGVPAERVHPIHLGVDHTCFTPDGPGPLGLPERYVLYPANFWRHKNHERLLEAFTQVTDPSLHLVLTGQPYDRGDIAAGRERVLMLNHVPAGDLPVLYRGALAIVFPSLFEGFGLPVLEAMASGTPVACSDRGALSEVAGDAALTFDPGKPEAIAAAIAAVTGDEPLRARLRAAGLARAAGFTWRAAAERHLEVYRSVA